MSADPSRDAELEQLRAALYAPGAGPEAADRYRAAVGRAAPALDEASAGRAADRPAEADGTPVRPPSGLHRRRTALVAAGVLVAAAGTALLLSPRPVVEPAAEPIRTGAALWAASGATAAASPVLDGRGAPVLVRLRCRGEGRILLAIDGRLRSVTCAADRTVRDDQYFDGAQGDFMLSLSLVGSPSWSASVHRVVLPATSG